MMTEIFTAAGMHSTAFRRFFAFGADGTVVQ